MSSSRLSLQDCSVQLRIPPPPPSTENQTLENLTLQVANAAAHDLAEAYIGETIFLIIVITPPEGSATLTNILQAALQTIGDVDATLTPVTPSASPSHLPVLRESQWTPSTALSGLSRHGVCKGLWVLVRTPPQTTHSSSHLAVAGPHNLSISLHEKPVSTLRNSPVWATIDRASRLFAKSVALNASKPLMLSMPIDIDCHQFTVSGSIDRAFVNVTARNATSDAHLSIVPPYINLVSSRILSTSGTPSETSTPALSLDDHYQFVPIFETPTISQPASNDAPLTSPSQPLSRETSGASCEDYSLFIPSFNHWLRRAVPLGPRQVYNFVYQIVHRGIPNPQSPNNVNTPLPPPPLHATNSVMTCIAVAWSCALADTPVPVPTDALHREMSSGAVLATGRRGNVSVHVTAIHWRPPALVRGVVVSFSGPSRAHVGARVNVAVSVLNQTARSLERACVMVQQHGAVKELLALRTVISIGDIAPCGETSLQLPCIALRTGTVSLGVVKVVDRANGGQTVWVSDTEFRIIVSEKEQEDHEEVGKSEDGKEAEQCDSVMQSMKPVAV